MSKIVTGLLVDTNVWLDSFVPSRTGHDSAKELIAFSLSNGVPLLYAPTSIKDVEFIAAASFKRAVRAQGNPVDEACATVARQFAWSCVQSMRRIATAVGMDESDVWLAEKFHAIHPDFEDDLLLAAAKRSGADYLVTNDNKLITHATVPVITPRDLLTLMHELGE